MKITHKTGTDKRLIAVISGTKESFFLPSKFDSNMHYYVNKDGVQEQEGTLESIADHPERTPVYEGDKFIIQF